MWHPLGEDNIKHLEMKFKCRIGKSLCETVQQYGKGIQEGNRPIMLVPCIVTGRVGDCIRDRLKIGRKNYWYYNHMLI